MVDRETADLLSAIRNVPDFPKKGIVFRDITTLLKDAGSFRRVVDILYEKYKKVPVDKIVSVESRGFIFAGPLAYKMNIGFVPIRKPNKLPAETARKEYALEYGTDAIEIHKDAIRAGDRILLHDDLLATGGTIAAAADLVESLGGVVVGMSFLVELSFLAGRKRLSKYDIFSILQYETE